MIFVILFLVALGIGWLAMISHSWVRDWYDYKFAQGMPPWKFAYHNWQLLQLFIYNPHHLPPWLQPIIIVFWPIAMLGKVLYRTIAMIGSLTTRVFQSLGLN